VDLVAADLFRRPLGLEVLQESYGQREGRQARADIEHTRQVSPPPLDCYNSGEGMNMRKLNTWGSLLTATLGAVLLTGCPTTSNVPNGHVSVGITGINNNDRLTAPRAITVTASSSGGHITHLECAIDGNNVVDHDFDNSSVTQGVTLPAGVGDMGSHVFTATATDANSNTSSSTVAYTVSP
jgi:hypothetical protein